MLPQEQDSQHTRSEKVMNLVRSYYEGYLGCTRAQSFYESFIFQTIAEVKTAILEEAIKNNHQSIFKFRKLIDSMVVAIPDDLGEDSQSTLFNLPMIRAVTYEISDLQVQVDKLRAAY